MCNYLNERLLTHCIGINMTVDEKGLFEARRITGFPPALGNQTHNYYVYTVSVRC